MNFDENFSIFNDSWVQTPVGRYITERKKELILDLTAPQGGEKLLDVGCHTGEHLILFRKKGCDVTGLEPSSLMLDLARQKLGNGADFYRGEVEDLPFSDNEFDIVTLIFSLQFADNPETAISEAIRVCRGRIFVGFLNKYSFISTQQKLRGLFKSFPHNNVRYFHIGELIALIRSQLQDVPIKWGSVVFLPYDWYKYAARLEEIIPVMKNPFGAFVGLSFPIKFTHTTVQDIIGNPFEIKVDKRQPAHGVIRSL